LDIVVEGRGGILKEFVKESERKRQRIMIIIKDNQFKVLFFRTHNYNSLISPLSPPTGDTHRPYKNPSLKDPW
jgi:hypothetical protein